MLGVRTVRRLLLRLNVCGLICFMILALHNPGNQPTSTKQSRMSNYREFFDDAPHFGVKYGSSKLPFIVHPLTKETYVSRKGETDRSKTSVIEYLSDRIIELRIMEHNQVIINPHYVADPPPPPALWDNMHLMSDQGVQRSTQPWEYTIDSVKDFFTYVKTPQSSCRKLVKMGGQPLCDEDEQMFVDGHKLVCMDAPLLKSKSDPTNCLVLSFGVFHDWSFDEAIARYNCELHMFDVKRFPENVTTKYPWTHYHVEGLSASSVPHVNVYPSYNASAMMLDYTNLLHKHNLTSRPVNILKIDIEGDEWEVLKSLRDNPYLSAVGQIHLEIHSHDILKKKTVEGQVSMMQLQYDILRDIESLGFARIGYWDNVMDRYAFYDEHNQRYDTAGELLYINTNWFKEEFIDQLRSIGIDIPR